jgi:hypothetical protein
MNNEYPVSDLGSAAYLLTIGKKLIRLERSNPRRIVFCFERNGDIEKEVQMYLDGTARVPPLALLANQKTLKAYIFGNQQPS